MASSIHPSMDTSRSTGWEYTEPESYNVIDTHVHVWETDGVMSAKSGVASTSPHATPGLRSAPPRWESEPTDSGRVELLLDDMERERRLAAPPRGLRHHPTPPHPTPLSQATTISCPRRLGPPRQR